MTPPLSFYFHFPFCSGRCTYCAFPSGAPLSAEGYREYIGGLARVFDSFFAAPLPCRTLYFGGGTPGLMGTEGFSRWCDAFLEKRLLLQPETEWTVELHPETVTEALLEHLRQAGVSRISIGVQVLDDPALLRLNRRHTAAQALEAFQMAAHAGFADVGADLIAGLPGVSDRVWEKTLHEMIALKPDHLSLYGLSIDEGSALFRQNGTVDAESLMDAVARGVRELTAAGFQRVETSNFARPGSACRHNAAYWLGADYLGLGAGAALRLGTLRRTWQNKASAWNRAEPAPPADDERLSPLADALERALPRLRTMFGFSPSEIGQAFPLLAPMQELWTERLRCFSRAGLVAETDAGRFVPTARGHEVVDGIIRDLLGDVAKHDLSPE